MPFVGYDAASGTAEAAELGLEGAHSQRRVLRVGSGPAGRALMKTLWELACREPLISISQGTTLLQLLQWEHDGLAGCRGAVLLDINDQVFAVTASQTILASGGYTQVYSRATTPAVSTGDGLAIAARLGVKVAGLARVQFHPTALIKPKGGYLLISETVRGEGALLRDQSGKRFCIDYVGAAGELANRKAVSEAILAHEAAGNQCFLDCRAFDPALWSGRFAWLRSLCLEQGFDPHRDLLPVTSVAHYSIGGLSVDLDGQTSLAGLYAIGELAHTGLHGADRLASNSLLECIVGAFGTAEAILASRAPAEQMAAATATDLAVSEQRLTNATALSEQLREQLWLVAGPRPQPAQFEMLASWLRALQAELPATASADLPTQTLRNLCTIGQLLLADLSA